MPADSMGNENATAHGEGGTLVVESSGFNGKAWLDYVGHPASESLRVIERFGDKISVR